MNHENTVGCFLPEPNIPSDKRDKLIEQNYHLEGHCFSFMNNPTTFQTIQLKEGTLCHINTVARCRKLLEQQIDPHFFTFISYLRDKNIMQPSPIQWMNVPSYCCSIHNRTIIQFRDDYTSYFLFLGVQMIIVSISPTENPLLDIACVFCSEWRNFRQTYVGSVQMVPPSDNVYYVAISTDVKHTFQHSGSTHDIHFMACHIGSEFVRSILYTPETIRTFELAEDTQRKHQGFPKVCIDLGSQDENIEAHPENVKIFNDLLDAATKIHEDIAQVQAAVARHQQQPRPDGGGTQKVNPRGKKKRFQPHINKPPAPGD